MIQYNNKKDSNMSNRRFKYGPAPICNRCQFCISAFDLPANTPHHMEASKAKGEFLCVLSKGVFPVTDTENDPCGFFANPNVHPKNYKDNPAAYLEAFESLYEATKRAQPESNKDKVMTHALSFYNEWWGAYDYWNDYAPYAVDPTFTCEHFKWRE